MQPAVRRLLTGALLTTSACAGRSAVTASPASIVTPQAGALAQIYFWRARPGKLDEYNRYIREFAEPIDREAQRRGAFISVTTYVSRDTTTTWTHMRVFVLRDSAQLRGLAQALDSAGIRLEPDSARRRMRAEYSANLRDRVGAATVDVLR